MNTARSLAALTAFLAIVGVGRAEMMDGSRAMQQPSRAPPPLPMPPVRADDIFPPGELRLPVRTANDLPTPFREAAIATNCKLENLSTEPGELVRVVVQSQRDRVLAILPCALGIGPRHGIYMLRRREARADALTLPAMERFGGIVATRFPGWPVWDHESATLIVRLGSDMIPHMAFRHHYKLNGAGEDYNPLVLVRVDKRYEDSGATRADWQTIWEAPDRGVVNIK